MRILQYSIVPHNNFSALYTFLCFHQFCTQKQLPIGVPIKRCSENMQQIYRRTSTQKCDFNKTAKQLYWNHTPAWVFFCKFAAYFQNTFLYEHLYTPFLYEHTSAWVFSCKFAAYFQNIFSKNTSGGLLLCTSETCYWVWSYHDCFWECLF